MNYSFIVCDTETTGLSNIDHDVIELSLCRLSDDEQKTWLLKPLKPENIDVNALRVNKHKMEDLLHHTQYGRESYLDPHQVIIEIENWLSLDNVPSAQRVMIGQNVYFDLMFLEQLWTKCGSKDSFPFGRRTMDTMTFAFMMDYVEGTFSENYSLSGLIKKYGIKNERAHSAAADTKATKELFKKQVEELRKKMNIK
jgi:DNA polymerase III epsilon subunit-like protein